MGKPRRAYSDTLVAPEKSMGEAMALLRKRDATGLAWTEEGPRATLRFRWRSTNGTELCARFSLEVKLPPVPRGGVRRTSKQIDEALEKEKRRLFRVLVHFIKNLLEAVDGGLLTLEQALLPHLEDATGRTVAELITPHLDRLAGNPLVRALGPGEVPHG